MGSVTIFFILPFMLIGMFFSSLFGAITGNDKTKVELPYDEAKGLIWDCEEDAEWFDVSEMKIDGDKQIFTFEGASVFGGYKNVNSGIFGVVFTAENSEKVVYMAARDGDYIALKYKVKLYSPDEYGIIEYTPEETFSVDGAQWLMGAYTKEYKTETVDGKNTFTFIYLPDGDGKTSFANELIYASKNEDDIWRNHEKINFYVELENGKAEIKEEVHEYYVDGTWTENKPEIK